MSFWNILTESAKRKILYTTRLRPKTRCDEVNWHLKNCYPGMIKRLGRDIMTIQRYRNIRAEVVAKSGTRLNSVQVINSISTTSAYDLMPEVYYDDRLTISCTPVLWGQKGMSCKQTIDETSQWNKIDDQKLVHRNETRNTQ